MVRTERLIADYDALRLVRDRLSRMEKENADWEELTRSTEG